MGLVEGTRIGKYELKKKLGEGGFGLVFKGYDTDLERDVALKFMHAQHTSNPEILQRFLQEARSAAKISHPGIVTVFECSQITGTGTDADGMAFIAMELLHGESLADRLQRQGRLGSPAAIEITRQIAIALEAAHRTNIIHRDLKPDNVYLVIDPAMPGGERVKVLDFGIAKLSRQQAPSVQTQSQMVFGTPRYMSPEQCRSAAKIDHRSDIYTLGCILFELVTGEPPFDGEVGELIAKHQMVTAPAACARTPDVPPALDRLIARTLSKQPGDRPQTMAELVRELEAIGGGASAGAAGTSNAGLAPTLPPEPAESLQGFTPVPGSVPPRDAKAIAAARGAVATTLNAASVARVTTAGDRRRPARTYAIAGVAVIALAAGGIFLATRDAPSVTDESVVASPPPGGQLPLPDARPATPPPEEIEITIDATPQAEVYLVADGRFLGQTPYRTRRAPAEGALVFVLKADQHADQRVVVPADHDFSRTFELVALAKPAAHTGSAATTHAKPPSRPTKPPPIKPPVQTGSSGHIEVYPD